MTMRYSFAGGRRRMMVPVMAVAGLLAAASAAWACTVSGGSATYVGPNHGPAGTSFTASASGAPTFNQKYVLKFADAAVLSTTGNTCRVNGVKVGGPTVSNGWGYVANTAGIVPVAAVQGNGQVCFVQKLNNVNATTPALFTVT